MAINIDKLSIPILLLLGSLILGCDNERPTQVKVQGGETPSFLFKGSGKLGTFSVYLVPPSPEDMSQPFSQQVPAWRISALPDYLHGSRVEDLGTLDYGRIPKGYKQEVPSRGDPNSSFIPGRDYFFEALTTDAPPTAGFFRAENGKTVVTKVKTPCWSTKNGEWVRSACLE